VINRWIVDGVVWASHYPLPPTPPLFFVEKIYPYPQFFILENKKKIIIFTIKEKKMIKINKHPESIDNMSNLIESGFTMVFDNGNTISVQFGEFNYCSNKDQGTKNKATSAEVAIWNSDGTWYDFGDEVYIKGWCGVDEVAKWIAFAATNIF
jgi:hypothetical protein